MRPYIQFAGSFAASLWVAAGLFTGAAVSAQAPGQLALGDKAPPIDVYFLQGDPIDLESGKGKQVFIVEFWATWCGPCRYSIPHLTELQQKHEDDGLVIVGISDESSTLVRPYMEQMGEKMQYRVAVDNNDTTNRRYFGGFGRVQSYPTAFVIDVNGRVAWIGNPLDPFLDTFVETLLEDVPDGADEDLDTSDPKSARSDE